MSVESVFRFKCDLCGATVQIETPNEKVWFSSMANTRKPHGWASVDDHSVHGCEKCMRSYQSKVSYWEQSKKAATKTTDLDEAALVLWKRVWEEDKRRKEAYDKQFPRPVSPLEELRKQIRREGRK